MARALAGRSLVSVAEWTKQKVRIQPVSYIKCTLHFDAPHHGNPKYNLFPLAIIGICLGIIFATWSTVWINMDIGSYQYKSYCGRNKAFVAGWLSRQSLGQTKAIKVLSLILMNPTLRMESVLFTSFKQKRYLTSNFSYRDQSHNRRIILIFPRPPMLWINSYHVA